MQEIMYNQSSILIVTVLFITLVLAMEVGYRLGRRTQARTDAEAKSHINAIQASLLGVLALMLGFTFSLSLQRYDSRSLAVVDEANAIGTAFLRSHLLPPPVRGEVQRMLRDYVDVRVEESMVPLSDEAKRHILLAQAAQNQNDLWRYAMQAVEEDDRPTTTGLFIQSLNELIDSYGRRNAALNRHIPEIVLFLLFGTFIMTWGIVGYGAGVTGHRPPFVAYIMLLLVVLLILIIIDLDRPRRGLIEINHTSLTELQSAIQSAQDEGGQE